MTAITVQQTPAPANPFSRRLLLGMFAATPFMAGGAVAFGSRADASTDTAAWDQAFAKWRAADLSSDLGGEAAVDAEHAAWRELIFTPAPHVAALSWKLEFLFGECTTDGYCDSWATEIVNAVLADARRLSATRRAS